MVIEIGAATFRKNLRQMLNHVQYRNDSVVINKNGKPVAVLVDGQLFTRILRMRARFDALCGRLAEGYAGTPADEGLAEIASTVVRERAK